MSILYKFNQFIADCMNGEHNLASDQLKVMLTNTLPVNTDTTTADITEIAAGNGYTTGGENITVLSSAQTSGQYNLVASDLLFTASGGSFGPFQYLVTYNSTNSKLICWHDYYSEVTLLDGEAFTWDATTDGSILRLQ